MGYYDERKPVTLIILIILMGLIMIGVVVYAYIDYSNSKTRCKEAGYDSMERIGSDPKCINYSTEQRIARGIS